METLVQNFFRIPFPFQTIITPKQTEERSFTLLCAGNFHNVHLNNGGP